MREKQTKTWQQNMLGITFRYADGRITVFRSALESIGRPEFYHFLYNPTKQMFAIQEPCLELCVAGVSQYR